MTPEVEDLTGTWPSKRLHALFSFVDAVGLAMIIRRGKAVAWCPDLWADKDARRFARENHAAE